jgi:hypothetical protein
MSLLNALNNIEDYIKTTINGSYSPLTVTKLISYDKQQNAFVGVFLGSNSVTYSFYIQQTDGLPMIKPIKE